MPQGQLSSTAVARHWESSATVTLSGQYSHAQATRASSVAQVRCRTILLSAAAGERTMTSGPALINYPHEGFGLALLPTAGSSKGRACLSHAHTMALPCLHLQGQLYRAQVREGALSSGATSKGRVSSPTLLLWVSALPLCPGKVWGWISHANTFG